MNGSDDATGSMTHPMRSIQAAVDASGPGDTVIVRGGQYAPFTIGVAGRPNAPFTVRGADGETAVVDGSSLGAAATIKIRDAAASVTVEGLTVTGATGYRSAGVLVENVVGGPIDLRDLVVTGNPGFGLDVYQSRNVTIEASEFTHNGTGVVVIREGSGVVIRGNDIDHNDQMIRNTPTPTHDDYGADGVSLVGTSGPVLVTENRLWGNRAPSDDYVWDGGAFSIFGASNVTISGNLSWDNENVLETGTNGSPCAGNQFVRNVAWGATTEGRSLGIILRCGQDMLVAHNTIDGLARFILSLDDDNSTFAGSIAGAHIVDNIFVMAGGDKVFGLPAPGALSPDVLIDGDLIWSPDGEVATILGQPAVRDLATFQRLTGYEPDGISADPMFRNADVADFRLLPGSPAIDRAIAITGLDEPYTGAAADIGRWEFAATDGN